MRSKFNIEYYSKLYGKEFADKQQEWFEEYLSGKKSGFTPRINFILKEIEQYLNKSKILDLGCGIGTFALILAKIGYKTIGLDPSQESINKSKLNAEKLQLKNCKFVLGSATDNNFKNNSFNGIICADVLEHLPQNVLLNTLTNCYNWLNVNGYMIIHSFPTYYYYLLLGKKSILMLPTVLPFEKFNKFYIMLIDKLLNFIYFLKTGTTHAHLVAHSTHCNPPNYSKLKKILHSTNFKIIKYELLKDPMSNLKCDFPYYPFFAKFAIKRNDILRPSILIILKKQTI